MLKNEGEMVWDFSEFKEMRIKSYIFDAEKEFDGDLNGDL